MGSIFAPSPTMATLRKTRAGHSVNAPDVVLTNPDMLHSGILPHHTKWAKCFENLRYGVIDELHYYRGVTAVHLANVVRRLGGFAKILMGSKPRVHCCSATLANPKELARPLTGIAPWSW